MQSGFGPRRRGIANPGIGNLVGDPFAFATVSIGALGWLLTMVASVFCQIRQPPSDPFPKFIWWVVAYEFMCVVLVAFTIIQDVSVKYSTAVVGYLAVGCGFTTLSINQLIFAPEAERVANAVGFILLSIVSFLWIFYFGSNGDSYGPPPKDLRYSTRQSRPMSHNQFSDRPRTTASGANPQGLYTSAQLNGFETSSPVSGYPGGPVGAQDRTGSQPKFGTNPQTPTTMRGPNTMMDGDVEQPTDYPYRAKAIYSYEANADDANEISFSKHEILDVSDVSGRWWQARKENGEKGIAPSNYLILL